MKQSNVFPLLLLFGGLGAALALGVLIAEAFLADAAPTSKEFILFGIACVIAGIGWVELSATEDFNETFYSE